METATTDPALGFGVQFTFALEQQVTIKVSDRLGIVTGLWIDRDFTQSCRIEYVLETGEVKVEWFRDADLEVR